VIDRETRSFVIARANDRCEYCLVPQSARRLTFNLDHVIATQHQPNDDPNNLCFCCPKCNRKKGPDLSGIDPATQTIVPLFHPRQQVWAEHFQPNGPLIVGTTPTGRATVSVLDLNHEERIRFRQSLMDEGLWPGKWK
jgi:hypothetical protein